MALSGPPQRPQLGRSVRRRTPGPILYFLRGTDLSYEGAHHGGRSFRGSRTRRAAGRARAALPPVVSVRLRVGGLAVSAAGDRRERNDRGIPLRGASASLASAPGSPRKSQRVRRHLMEGKRSVVDVRQYGRTRGGQLRRAASILE